MPLRIIESLRLNFLNHNFNRPQTMRTLVSSSSRILPTLSTIIIHPWFNHFGYFFSRVHFWQGGWSLSHFWNVGYVIFPSATRSHDIAAKYVWFWDNILFAQTSAIWYRIVLPFRTKFLSWRMNSPLYHNSHPRLWFRGSVYFIILHALIFQ